MERRLWIDRGYYTLFPNLYVFIIGRSGLIKKSTSTGMAVDLLRELPNFNMMSERLTAGSLIEQFQISGRKFKYRHKDIRQSALFAYASELAVFLAEVFGSTTELLTTFYDCVPRDSEKPWVYQSVKKGQVKIYGPCLNILGASTKAWLQKCIPHSEMEGGFTSRVIFVVENKIPEKLVAWPEVNEKQNFAKLQLIADLKHIHNLCGEFQVTDEAKKYFEKWYKHHMQNVVPLNQDARMSGYMARKPDTILKLSMIHSIAEGDDLFIEKDDIKWGLNEMNELEPDMRMAFEGVSSNRADNLPWEIRNFVMNRMAVTIQEVIQTFGPQHHASDIIKSVDQLVAMNEIVEKENLYTCPGVERLE